MHVHNGKQDRHERAGRSGDLKTRATEQRHDQACDDAGPEALLRRHTRSDAKPDRQRQRDDADGETRADVSKKIGATITTERRDNGRTEPSHDRQSNGMRVTGARLLSYRTRVAGGNGDRWLRRFSSVPLEFVPPAEDKPHRKGSRHHGSRYDAHDIASFRAACHSKFINYSSPLTIQASSVKPLTRR